MRRLWATFTCDLRLQYRHGFSLAAAAVALGWVLGLVRVSDSRLDDLLPVFILGSLVVTVFNFTAGQVLLEKAEGTLAMRDATPLRPHEYLASKALASALLAVLTGLALVLIVRGPSFRPILFILGTASAAALLVFAGFFTVSWRPSVKGFLATSPHWVLAMVPPFLPALGLTDDPLIRLHPLAAPLTLLRAAFAGTGADSGAGEIAYGLAASGAWALVGLRACKGACERLRQAGE